MQGQKDDFRLTNYNRCIEDSLSLGYSFLTLGEFFDNKKLNNKNIILRHDVDTQLEIAVEMAKIEFTKKVKATYFFRMHSHAYNFLCLKDLYKIKSIKDLGHEIGLHYESDFYSINNKAIVESIEKEVDLMKYFLDTDIKTVCPHEPTRTNCFHINNLNFYQAYDQKLFKSFKYISDSSCRWRDGSFYENINAGHKNIYVLTHPYWWYNQSPIENY
jgi:hypothetical protein